MTNLNQKYKDRQPLETIQIIKDFFYSQNYTIEEEINEIIQEDIAFEIYEVRDDAPSFEELEAMYLDPESYIKEYCQPCQD